MTALWTAQVLLAAIFLATGLTKLTQPRVQQAAGPMGWAADVSDVAERRHVDAMIDAPLRHAGLPRDSEDAVRRCDGGT